MISTARNLTKRAAVGATAAIVALQLLAGASQAALPTATVNDVATPDAFSAGNDAGFTTTFLQQDSSTLSKLFGEIDVTGATTSTYIAVTLNGKAVAGACNAVGNLPVLCQFKNVRPNSVITVTVGVTPASFAAGSTVSMKSTWTTTGFGSGGGDNSHGDTWFDLDGGAIATFNGSGDFAGGFNETSIANFQVVDKVNNTQAARLANLPAGVPASVDDSPTNTFPCANTPTVNCSALTGSWVSVDVAGGATVSTAFQVLIKYYSGTPSAFVHVYTDASGATQQETINACGKKAINPPCFTWSNQTNTATIYTFHNGGYKRL